MMSNSQSGIISTLPLRERLNATKVHLQIVAGDPKIRMIGSRPQAGF